MNDILLSLISIIEILILGVFSLIAIVYFIVTFHPLKAYLINYHKVIFDFLGNEVIPDDYKKYIKSIALIGIVYYGGTLVNIVDYWFLQPLHLQVIKEVERYEKEPTRIPEDKKTNIVKKIVHISGKDTTTTIYDTLTVSHSKKKRFESKIRSWDYNRNLSYYLFIPIDYNFKNDTTLISQYEVDNYLCYLNRSSHWSNNSPEVAGGSLSDMRKFIRLVRGTLFISFIVLLIALFKLGISIIVSVFQVRKNAFSNWLYQNFIDNSNSSEPTWKEAIKRVFIPNLIIGVFAMFTYSLSVKSYVFLEREFHSTVIEGEESSISPSSKK